ncbi:hypothetical protein DLM75_04005 [Leptospira stimsonii]|uniref:Uncharacterized protein n=1 Tax=Leptospira stimsonii TaxID=2202203 RepID=A0A396ZFV0_9LEPT|nr:hypothetical protein DLM75_04005 [Leptospira stimsonii]
MNSTIGRESLESISFGRVNAANTRDFRFNVESGFENLYSSKLASADFSSLKSRIELQLKRKNSRTKPIEERGYERFKILPQYLLNRKLVLERVF